LRSVARDQHMDVVLIDTAGRMQDNEPLMRSLTKVREMSPTTVAGLNTVWNLLTPQKVHSAARAIVKCVADSLWWLPVVW